MAAAACASFDQAFPLLPEVHALTKRTAAKAEKLGYKFTLPVQTNMIVLDLEASDIPGEALVAYCQKHEVKVFPSGRMVFHHQTTEDGAERLVLALKELMEDKTKGVEFQISSMPVGTAVGCS